MNAKPKAQNRMPQSAVSTMHSSRMLTTSRVRAKPASSIMKPACMKNTRKAATSIQTVFSGVDHVLRGRRIRGALRAGHRVEEGREDLQCHQQEHDAEHLADEVHREEATRFLLASAFL